MPLIVPVKVPAGTVAYFSLASAPAGYLICDGAAISRSVYAELFFWIGMTYGGGDGSTTFNLPDLRGEFIRCADLGRGIDAGRGVGTYQSGSLISNKVNAAGSIIVTDPDSSVGSSQTTINTTGTSNASANITIRPRNVAMLPCIKF